MKQERVILSFIMVLIGLLVAGTLFYFYQSNKKVPQIITAQLTPTPTPISSDRVKLSISSPSDESVVANKNLTVSGITNPGATVIIITGSDQDVETATSKGQFNGSITLSNDQNLITVISVLPTGESRQVQETVTFSTSNF